MVTSIEELQIPSELLLHSALDSEEQLRTWENTLADFFTEHSKLFTPYPEYFKTRCFEFRILRQLLSQHFRPDQKYKTGLELGCGYGYTSLLLARYCERLLATDIPVKYAGYVRGNYESSVDIARLIVNQKFNQRHVQFDTAWPNELKHIENESIDFLFTEYLLEHIPDLPAAIAEMYRVMQPGGLMIHIVPTTQDAIVTFLQAQVDLPAKTMLSGLMRKIFKQPGGGRYKLNGLVMPPCHSEFANEFGEQLDIYTLDHFVFPMVEIGFKIEQITTTREYNRVIVARK